MKKILYRAKRSWCNEIVEGQLVWIEGRAHIIRDCDIEECGHHFVQCSDIPTWIDENTIEPIIDEKELEKSAKEDSEVYGLCFAEHSLQCQVNRKEGFYDGFKAGYKKGKENI